MQTTGRQFTTIYGRNLIGELPNFVHRPYLVVTMEDLWPKFEHYFDDNLAGVHFVDTLELEDLGKIVEQLPRCNSVIGLGGGQAVDIAKFIAWVRRLPLFQVPTDMTVNAPFGHRAGIRDKGKVRYMGWAVPEAVYVDFDVILNGSDDNFLSIDMNKVSSKAANFKIHTECGTWQRVDASGSDDPADKDIARIQVKLLSTQAAPIEGCTDAQASNYDTDATVDDGSCSFSTATISSFTVTPSSITQGSSSIVSWQLSNGNFSEVKLLENGTNIMPDAKKQAQSSNLTVSPSNIGNTTYKLQVIWNKPNAAQRNSSVKNVNVVSPTSFITCTDPNRNKDSNAGR